MDFEFREIDCPVCDATDCYTVGYRGGDAHHSGSGVRTRIVRCADCTHQYPNPMPFPVVSLSEMYGEADEYFVGHDLEEKKSSALGLVAELERRLGHKGSLLDIGSGRGELLWAARERGWKSVGIEPSKDFVQYGRRHLSVEPVSATLDDADLESESFDAVVMNGLIEHLYEPLAVVSEVKRVLKRDGWFYFDAPNEDGLYMSLGNAYMRARGKDWVVVLAPTFSPFHVQGFNPRSLKTLLTKAGFVSREFNVHGEVWPQTGSVSFRKRIEFNVARLANSIGNWVGRGSYMTVWAQNR
jgi:SAM-dependent methyltransferase